MTCCANIAGRRKQDHAADPAIGTPNSNQLRQGAVAVQHGAEPVQQVPGAGVQPEEPERLAAAGRHEGGPREGP